MSVEAENTCRGCRQPVPAGYSWHKGCRERYRGSSNYRQATLARDGYACAACFGLWNRLVLWFYATRWERSPELARRWLQQHRTVEVDHIDPLASATGSHDPSNLQVLCIRHHRRKTVHDVAQLRGRKAPRDRSWLYRSPRRLLVLLAALGGILLLTRGGGAGQLHAPVPGFYQQLGAPGTIPLPGIPQLIAAASLLILTGALIIRRRIHRGILAELHKSYAATTGASLTARRPIRGKRWRWVRDDDGGRPRLRPTVQTIRYPRTFRDTDPAQQLELERIVAARCGGSWAARWNHRALSVTLTSPDPLESAEALPWPAMNAPAMNLWDPIPVALDEAGRTVTVELAERNLLIGGEPGAGKSVALNLICAAVALDPNVEFYGIDGKGLVELSTWKDSMTELVGSDDGMEEGKGQREANELLGKLQLIMNHRYATMAMTGTKKITPDSGMDLIVLVVDELALFTAGGDKKLREEFVSRLRDLISRGRAAGVISILATQRPSATVVPTEVRDLIGFRWAFRCSTPATSDMVLGQGWASAGFSAAKVQAAFRGVGLLLAEGAVPRRCRSFLATDPELDVIAARAASLRARGGVEPAASAVQDA